MSQTIQKPALVKTTEEPDLLHEIIDRMSVIEAKQSRPSPVQLRNWEEIERFAEKAAKSGMVPKDFIGNPDAICIAVMMGAELGLAAMQALQNIAVVNGRPAIWGDAMPALCRASGICRSIREWSESDGDALTYYCEAIRKDDPTPIIGKFSVLDARRAGLWKELPKVTKQTRDGRSYEADSGPWYSYPKRMLQMRARGFALRDAFPDVLRGLVSAEEAADIPFEATGLTPRHEPSRDPPMPPTEAVTPDAPKRPTVTQWLDTLEIELRGACEASDGTERVDAVLARDDVYKAQDAFRNGAKERLMAMIATALEATKAPASDVENDPTNVPENQVAQ
jgi:hypothetical protein